MAYGFGTTVNPQLGAVDYSNYLRGALTGAQMQAEGGAAIGRGIASGLSSIGSEIGSGMKQYAENKKKLKAQEGSIKSVSTLFSSALNVEQGKDNPQADVVTYLQDALNKLNDPSASTDERYAYSQNAVTGLSNIIQLGAASAKEQEAQNSARYGNLLRRFNGKIPRMIDTRGFTQEEIAEGTNQWLNQRLLEQQGTPKPENLSFPQQSVKAELIAFVDRNGRQPTAAETAQIYADVQGRSRSVTQINTGEKYADQETAKAMVKRNQDLLSGAESGEATMRKTIELKNLLENEDVNTGMFANITQGIDRFVAGFGGKEAIKRASQTELAQAFMGSEVFQLFQQLGVGARGLDTPAERDFMMKVLTGDITMQKQAILGLAKRRYDEGRRAVEKYNSALGKSEKYRSWVDEYTMGTAPVYEVIDWSDSRSDSGLPSGEIEKQGVRVRTYNPQTGRLE